MGHGVIGLRITCKTYENLSFLQKKWLSNAKSMTRNTQRQNLSSKYYKNTIEGLTTSSNNLPNRPKYLGYLEISSHWVSIVRSIIYPKRRRQRHIPITREIRAWNQKVDLAKPKVLGIRAYRGLLINACCMMWVQDYLFTKFGKLETKLSTKSENGFSRPKF